MSELVLHDETFFIIDKQILSITFSSLNMIDPKTVTLMMH